MEVSEEGVCLWKTYFLILEIFLEEVLAASEDSVVVEIVPADVLIGVPTYGLK